MGTSNPWNSPTTLNNSSQFMQNQNIGSLLGTTNRPGPIPPPKPYSNVNGPLNSYTSPYSFSSYGSPYGGGFRSPYQGSMYSPYSGSYGGYSGLGPYENYSMYSRDDHERRFIQYAEESSRQTFASVESVVRAFNSLATMLDNTFFAMTSSFRAILGVADNFGKLRTMFGHIWYSVNIFRFMTWMYRKIRKMLGLKVPHSATSLAWKESLTNGMGPQTPPPPGGGSSWPTIAFLGVIVSLPYIISKFLPRYEDKLDPANWKSPGIAAKACFDFVATSPNELTLHTNDNILLAPAYVQEEMNLKNSGWAYAVHKNRGGMIPLNYIVINKRTSTVPDKILVSRQSNIKDSNDSAPQKTHAKKVSFGKIEIFDNDNSSVKNETIPVESAEK